MSRRNTKKQQIHAAVSAQASSKQQQGTVRPTPPVNPRDGSAHEFQFLVANANFMLNDVQNESMAEQLRERVRYYGEMEYAVDFALVCEPEWLEKNVPADQLAKLGRPAVALVSTEKDWMVFMRLRLDRVISGSFNATWEEATKGDSEKIPDFPPQKWIAPYSPYAKGWWEKFLPENVN